ncbi:hypothetical protein ACFLXX_00245 [Chloroflexota bacterium]
MFDKLLRVPRILLRKIIRRALLVSRIETWFGIVGQFYERIQFERERDISNSERGIRSLDFTHYLPYTEERIEKLRQVINGRPVAILLQGPSIIQLEERISELRDCDICYAGLNDFGVIEERILEKINRHLSLFMCSSLIDLRRQIENRNLFDYLERQEENLLVSEKESFLIQQLWQPFDLDEFVTKYDRRLLFFVSTFTFMKIQEGLFLPVPSIRYPLHFPKQGSFSILLSLALIGGASMIAVFGGDGGIIKKGEKYFGGYGKGKQEYGMDQGSSTDINVFTGTNIFNATMPVMLEKLREIYDIPPVDIVNCSVQSHYTSLRKLSYDKTIALLKSFKKNAG